MWYRQQGEAEVPHYVQKEFNEYLKCGILAHGFARAHCKGCKKRFFTRVFLQAKMCLSIL